MTLGVLHAGQVLDGARNAHGHIQPRRHHFAGLAHLVVVRRVAGVHGGAGCAHGSAQFVGQRLDHGLELLSRTQCAATRHHDLGGSQFRRSDGEFLADKAGQASVSSARDVSTAAAPPETAAGSKAVVRTVITLMASLIARWPSRCRRTPAHKGVGAFHRGDFADLGRRPAGRPRAAAGFAKVVAGASTWLHCLARSTTSGVRFSASGWPGRRRQPAAFRSRQQSVWRRPAAAAQPAPATSRWTSLPRFLRGGDGVQSARLDLAVVAFGDNQDSHSITAPLLRFSVWPPARLRRPTLTPAERLAARRLSGFSGAGSRPHPDRPGWFCPAAFLGGHDVGQLDVARLVQAQVGGQHGRQAELDGFRPPSTSRVTFTEPSPSSTFEANVPCAQPSSAAVIWPVWLASSSMACLPRITSCGLLWRPLA